MRIASFNINGIKARTPRLSEWLEETRPDIACLQEIKCQNADFPVETFERLGYHAVWHGQKSYNGVAILSRGAAPDVVMRGLPGDEEDTQARYLEASIAGIRIVCIYLPNGNPLPGPKFDYKLRWIERLRERMQTIWHEEVPVIVLGDYNIIPRDIDVWSPEAMVNDALMQDESRDGFSRLLGDGWSDVLGQHAPAGGIWTFWDYQAGAWPRNRGFRIDHALLSPELADRITDCGVDHSERGREQASDHAPIWIDLIPKCDELDSTAVG